MFLQRKLHKITTWVVFVMQDHIAIHIRFPSQYLGPCYEDRHACNLIIMGVWLIFEFTHI